MGKLNDFMGSRRCFALINAKHLAWACGCCIPMACSEWLEKEYGVTGRMYADMIHGFIHKDGYVILCKGFSRERIDMNDLPEPFFKQIVEFAIGYSGKDSVVVYNGQSIEEPGVLWSPIENLGKFKAEK